MFTVQQLRKDIAPYTLDAGKCRDSKYVLEYINDARRIMWPRGAFAGTMDTLCVQSSLGVLTLPLDYLKVTDGKTCAGSVQIDNEWYEYADNVQFSESCFHEMIDLGDKFASFRDYEYGNFRLEVMAESHLDVGKVVNFNAIGEHGDRLSLSVPLGKDHEPVRLNPWIKNFRHASKEKTEGRVRVYIYDPNRGNRHLCAFYEPDDLAIQYRRYRVPCRKVGSQYYVRCKKRYRELLRETDNVEFSPDALIQACVAITARRNKQLDQFTAALNLAIEHENKELGNDKIQTGGRIKMSRGHRVTNLLPPV